MFAKRWVLIKISRLGYCQNTEDFHWANSGSSRRGIRLAPSVQSTEVLDIMGQMSRGWNPVASTRVGKMSTNSTSLLVLKLELDASEACGMAKMRGAWLATC